MSNTRVTNKNSILLDFVVQKDDGIVKVIDSNILTKFINLFPLAKRINLKNYPNTRIAEINHNALIRDELPFRVRFQNKGVIAYGPGNPPPIGVAVIGTNNYIL